MKNTRINIAIFRKNSYVIHCYVNLCADSKLTSEPFDSKFQPIHNFNVKIIYVIYAYLFSGSRSASEKYD